MISTENLIRVADAYKVAASVAKDQTVSYRVFGDSKKLESLRAGADITLGRYNDALIWFRVNWPDDVDLPEDLLPVKVPSQPKEAAE